MTPEESPSVVEIQNQAQLEELACQAIWDARRRLKLTAVAWQEHRADMEQTALLTLCEFPGQPIAYVFGIVRHRLTDYALVHIYGRQTGKNSAYARGCTVHHVEDPEEAFETYVQRLSRRRGVARPVEEALVAAETEPARTRFWQAVERELLAILIATGGCKSKPDRLRRYVLVLLLRLQGLSIAAIALELGLTIAQVMDILERARQRIHQFLAYSPLMQGLIRAQGELRTCWPEDITPTVLNSQRHFVAVLPHGEFNIRYHGGKGYVQAAAKTNGRVQTRMVILGNVGSLTYEHLVKGTLTLQAKLLALRQAERHGRAVNVPVLTSRIAAVTAVA
ncbi:MAG: hypothetical protein KJ069_15950 [Anaerolineae bacterium]|nr:hypothetical protein [Anaerolineae bacterium]